MNSIYLPIIGQDSQPKETDGAELDFMRLPSSMYTYTMPKVPPQLNPQVLPKAKALLETLLNALNNYDPEQNYSFSTQTLNSEELALINQILGEGEVSIIVQEEITTQIQESVLAGVWRVQQFNNSGCIFDSIEIADIPQLIKTKTFENCKTQLQFDNNNLPDGLMNALPLIAELNAQISAYSIDKLAHVINLSLLPQTEQDLAFLYQLLGRGTVSILSRGYGTNRITSTQTDKVWWVQYFNSDDTLILNTLEISQVPSVALAALEDIADSAERLVEILAAL
ncbi:MAG: hydrogenase expression/formation C-terminal domain-containing protein [Methylococcaceae bacterium]